MTSRTRLVITAEARSTIEAIYTYTMETWDERQADAYDETLNRAFRRIQSFPWIGHVASNEDTSIREYTLRNHFILYRHDVDIDTVTILRIVNPRRLHR